MKIKSVLQLILSFIFFASLSGGVDTKVDRKAIHEAFVSKIPLTVPMEMVAVKPPQDRIEKPPFSPSPRSIWINGYWDWDQENQKYQWVCGVWRIPPPGMHWIEGFWKESSGWFRVPGTWHPSPSQVIIADKMPPMNPEEILTENKDQNQFWSPGYWEYNPYEKVYSFLSGSWQPFDPNWILIPGYWSWRQEGYLFHPPYWDYTLDKRGAAYDCEGGSTYWPLSQEVIISRIYYNYPSYLSIFAHHYHFQPEYWQNCWCLPPWWKWSDWWSMDKSHHWDLWWWWSHPGFAKPSWIDAATLSAIPAADPTLVELLKTGKKPFFITDKGVPSSEKWMRSIKRLTGKNDPLVLNTTPSPIVDDMLKSLPEPAPISSKDASAKKANTNGKPQFEPPPRSFGYAKIPWKASNDYIVNELNPVPTKTPPPVTNYTSPSQYEVPPPSTVLPAKEQEMETVPVILPTPPPSNRLNNKAEPFPEIKREPEVPATKTFVKTWLHKPQTKKTNSDIAEVEPVKKYIR